MSNPRTAVSPSPGHARQGKSLGATVVTVEVMFLTLANVRPDAKGLNDAMTIFGGEDGSALPPSGPNDTTPRAQYAAGSSGELTSRRDARSLPQLFKAVNRIWASANLTFRQGPTTTGRFHMPSKEVAQAKPSASRFGLNLAEPLAVPSVPPSRFGLALDAPFHPTGDAKITDDVAQDIMEEYFKKDERLVRLIMVPMLESKEAGVSIAIYRSALISDRAGPETVAHELGHIFGLDDNLEPGQTNLMTGVKLYNQSGVSVKDFRLVTTKMARSVSCSNNANFFGAKPLTCEDVYPDISVASP